MGAGTIRDCRGRHESLLTKVSPATLTAVATTLIPIEVSDIDDPKCSDRGECPGVRSVERVGTVSEFDGLALVIARQSQAPCKDVLNRPGAISTVQSFGRRPARGRLTNVRPVIVSTASGHAVVDSKLVGTHVRRRPVSGDRRHT